MIQKGKCICTRCFKEFSAEEAVYMNTDHKNFFITIRSRHSIQVKGPDEQICRILGKPEIEIQDGIVQYLSLTVDSSENTEVGKTELTVDTADRICPICLKNDGLIQHLPLHSGEADSYIIGLMGRPECGKTSFASCICSRVVQDRLSNILLRLCHSSNLTRNRSDMGMLKATLPGMLDLTHYVVIRVGHKKVILYLADVSGETYLIRWAKLGKKFQAKNRHIFRKYVDAILLIHDQRDLTSDVAFHGTTYKMEEDLMNEFLAQMSPNMPILCCVSKADLIQEYLKTKTMWTVLNESEKPVLSKDSPLFKQCDSSMEQLPAHMLLARDFMMAFVHGPITIGYDKPCFVFSSGRSRNSNDYNGSTVHSFKENCNPLFPILYLLRNWGILPGGIV